jgi:hypothetical protein
MGIFSSGNPKKVNEYITSLAIRKCDNLKYLYQECASIMYQKTNMQLGFSEKDLQAYIKIYYPGWYDEKTGKKVYSSYLTTNY